MLSIIEFVIHGALLGLAAYFAFDMIEGVLEQGWFSNDHYGDVGDLFITIGDSDVSDIVMLATL